VLVAVNNPTANSANQRVDAKSRPRDFSPEHTQRILTGKAPMTPCPDCRRPPVTLSEAERQRYERWWRRQLPDTELAEIARGI
jgi:hypothetical protein